nr:hypothetical protein [Tanacetum cinerariifolium]
GAGIAAAGGAAQCADGSAVGGGLRCLTAAVFAVSPGGGLLQRPRRRRTARFPDRHAADDLRRRRQYRPAGVRRADEDVRQQHALRVRLLRGTGAGDADSSEGCDQPAPVVQDQMQDVEPEPEVSPDVAAESDVQPEMVERVVASGEGVVRPVAIMDEEVAVEPEASGLDETTEVRRDVGVDRPL